MGENELKLDNRGLNLAISSNLLSEEKMRELGFTDCVPEKWYFCRYVSDDKETTFNVTIPKDGSRLAIDVFDENFLQPYDYQECLRIDLKNKYADIVKQNVESYMQHLSEKGVIVGWMPGIYI